ncbi:hypothetical protein P7B02_07090 [Caulobacter segnis]|uniref:hypothetical protein n=1 Tax=Caulobacter segnis TaxID=88688 RepID=UPI002410820B|nr:hypothetical protein [Caulobacter segnis]MDG2521304.1 hypothetical protein [Caulobacter segnis]
MNTSPTANILAALVLIGFIAAAWKVAPRLTRRGFRPRVSLMDDLMERVETRPSRPPDKVEIAPLKTAGDPDRPEG